MARAKADRADAREFMRRAGGAEGNKIAMAYRVPFDAAFERSDRERLKPDTPRRQHGRHLYLKFVDARLRPALD